jgi:hypothetical protein
MSLTHPTPPRPIERLGEAAARDLASQAATAELARLSEAASHCAELAACDLIAPGVREVFRQLAEQMEAGAQTVRSINARVS